MSKRPLLKPLGLICWIVFSLFAGVPLAMLGVIGALGGLDTGMGWIYGVLATLIWVITAVWYVWTKRDSIDQS